ncbi:Activin receptor type-2B, partial [Armadillidium vulgare]
QGGPVPEYVLPFEKEVGLHPTLDDMQECVVTRKKRPHVLDTWLNHPGLHEVIQMIRESWDHDAEARLSASCIVERFALLSRQPQLVHTSLSNKRVASF